MEKLAGAEPSSLESIKNDFEEYLKEFCTENDIKDQYDIYPAMWNAALTYICQNTFKANPSILAMPKNINNAYNLEAVDYILDIYAYECFIHNQEISVIGFHLFSGISLNAIYNLNNNNKRVVVYKDLEGNVISNLTVSRLKEGEYTKELSSKGGDIFKKLKLFSEESLTALMKDRRNNPMKYLPILNRRFGWNLPGVSRETFGKTALTAADLPKLGTELNENSAQLPQLEACETLNNSDTI